MSIKLIVSDMDGTLLNEKLEITDRTAQAIQSAQDKGIEFAIATGRPIASGYSFIQDKNISCPFIDLNGARLFDENKNVKFTRKINRTDLEELIQIIEHYKVHNEFITNKKTYSTNAMEETIQAYKKEFKAINKTITDGEVTRYVLNHLESNKIHQVDNYDFLINDFNIQVLKVLLSSTKDRITLNKIQKAITQNLPDIIVTSASNVNLEINHVLANKGQAVSDFAQMRNYQSDEVITIGDNINDLTMLDWADHSYAVANAHMQAKEIATYSAPNHTDDAVAQIIEKVLVGDTLSF